MDVENHGSTTITLSPTFFAAYSSCRNFFDDDRIDQCKQQVKNDTSLAINVKDPSSLIVTIRQRIDLPANVIEAIKSNNGKIAIAFEGGLAVPGLITNDGGSIVATGGGSLVTDNGSGIISKNGGGVVSNDGNSAIAARKW